MAQTIELQILKVQSQMAGSDHLSKFNTVKMNLERMYPVSCSRLSLRYSHEDRRSVKKKDL